MRVEIWSDVVCPWCYIGKRRFEQALERFLQATAADGADGDGTDVDVEVVFRPFQLDPTASPGVATPVSEVYSRKFGGPERAAQIIDRVTRIAADAGLTFRLDRAVRANTLLAHRLLWFARREGGAAMQASLKEALLEAYFTQGRNVADPDVLVGLAAEVGLDPTTARSFLDSDEGTTELMADLAEAADNDITAVPTFVFDGRWVVPGAQDVDVFERVLQRVAAMTT